MAASRRARIFLASIVLSAFTIAPAAAQWTPPLGIPAPSFGITNVAPATPNPWTTARAGFYYVDATIAASTDASNPYGTPAKPRKTIPLSLPAGAVVELHGAYDSAHTSPAGIMANGTASAPVYIRGVSATSRPIARHAWEVQGSYLIIENVEFGPQPDLSDSGSMVILLPSDHIVLRHSEMHGTTTSGGLGIVNWLVPYGTVYTGPGNLDNIVIWDNAIHDNGDVNATYDQDVHGIAVSDHVRYLWVVDNQLYRNSGDGIQVNAGSPGQGFTTHHVYIGRNVSHNNKQTGFWIKSAQDVILSQNESYGHRPSNSSLGQCMGGQYGPDWVWFLFNHAHDCEYGITQMSDNGEQSHWFLIGNIVENIHASQASDPSNSWGPSAIMMSGGYERHIINNTIFNVDSGVNISSPNGTIEIADNIISTITQSAASHVILGFPQNSSNTAFHHNLLFGDPRMDPGTGTQVHLTAAQLAQVFSTSGDPRFVNALAGDFHILSNSAAKGTGELNAVYGTFLARYGMSVAIDADGFVRSNPTDMGAYLASGQVGVVPVVTANPTDQAVGNGKTATFTAAATGTPTPGVQWQVSTNGGSSFSNVTGANSLSYSFVASPTDNGKKFRAVFVNTMGVAVTTAATLTVNTIPPSGSDIDGDRLGDLTIWRPSTSTWFTVTSSSGFNYASAVSRQWGIQSAGDMPFLGDIDGDGIADLVLWRASTGTWYWLLSSAGYSQAMVGSKQWGNQSLGDQPMLADIDGDGRLDLIVWRQSSGTFYWLTSSSGYDYGSAGSKQWGSGMLGDIPKVADVDGDGKADLIVWRPSTATWFWLPAASGYNYAAMGSKVWGTPGDTPLVADMDGNGKADFIVWHPANGTWYWTSTSGASAQGTTGVQWGLQSLGDVPLLTDLDGDGKADLIVWRPSSGTWFWVNSSSAYSYATYGTKQWGGQGDIPVVR